MVWCYNYVVVVMASVVLVLVVVVMSMGMVQGGGGGGGGGGRCIATKTLVDAMPHTAHLMPMGSCVCVTGIWEVPARPAGDQSQARRHGVTDTHATQKDIHMNTPTHTQIYTQKHLYTPTHPHIHKHARTIGIVGGVDPQLAREHHVPGNAHDEHTHTEER